MDALNPSLLLSQGLSNYQRGPTMSAAPPAIRQQLADEKAQQDALRIQAMLNSPFGSMAWLSAYTAGASPQGQDVALGLGQVAEGVALSWAGARAGAATEFLGAQTGANLPGDGTGCLLGSAATTTGEETAVIEPQPYTVPSEIHTSNGVPIRPDPEKTTTVLGSFAPGTPGNMEDIIKNQLHYPKTTDFGPKPGGFNVLNAPDDLFQTADQFWEQYNKPFLDAAMQRGDNITLATRPVDKFLFKDNGDLTGFGREVDYLQKNGYSYDSSSGQMIKH